jgi:hypothetical protein
MTNCTLCHREVEDFYIEKHHLIPKCKKGKETIDVCKDCGDYLHKVFTIKEMTKKYNTLEKILEHQKVQNWIKWLQKRPNLRNVCMKSLK